ncbi:flagellar FlbD family protein [Effusibacillus lacus]|uniref:Flagellar protein FlbD n=1 Tax=Effusibacillus lacus TaxID=1348429 RepID=A0A292YNP8_9BACL|nr:flagellar FlbD family protein [Effusibacillus lacus]TCS73126.1 flagellar protein FlbD [Effusibacillus lacus]GAX90531.1 flagellar protein FlbD [Effusibacillus lacus]
MIKVTRFNGSELTINATLIEVVEATPDTVITLVNNKKIVVREPVDEVVQMITDFYKTIGIVGLQVRQNAGC